MTIKLPLEIGQDVGYKSNMIRKINSGKAKPSPQKCREIIRAMAERGIRITLFDLRPDLKEVVMESL
jgi:hypothetical protein